MTDLTYREYAPSVPLAPFVRCIWTLRAPTGVFPAQPVVPDGCAEIIVHRGDPFHELATGGVGVPQPGALLVGAITSPVRIAPAGVVDVVGVRLQPWGGGAFLGVPMARFRGGIEALDAVHAPLQRELERVVDAVLETDVVSRLTSVLERHIRSRPAPDVAVREAISRVTGAATTPSVSQLARALGRSTRWVQRTFSATVGMTPKMLTRIARVQRSLRLAGARGARSWSAIAAEAGYFDHAHLVRDFRQFVGCTPSQFDPRRMPITDVFVER